MDVTLSEIVMVALVWPCLSMLFGTSTMCVGVPLLHTCMGVCPLGVAGPDFVCVARSLFDVTPSIVTGACWTGRIGRFTGACLAVAVLHAAVSHVLCAIISADLSRIVFVVVSGTWWYVWSAFMHFAHARRRDVCVGVLHCVSSWHVCASRLMRPHSTHILRLARVAIGIGWCLSRVHAHLVAPHCSACSLWYSLCA